MQLRANVVQIGNGIGIYIPKPIREACNLKKGKRVSIDILSFDEIMKESFKPMGKMPYIVITPVPIKRSMDYYDVEDP